MEISTEIASLKGYSQSANERIKLLKDSGFTAYDFSMFAFDIIEFDDYVKRAEELRSYADSIGIKCNQSHAPFPSRKYNDKSYNDKMSVMLERAIEVSGILGAKVCVIHPVNGWSAVENADMYKGLEKTARKYGVQIGLENMWNWDNEKDHAMPASCSDHDSFNEHLSLLDNEVFVACLDLGHAEMLGLNTDAPTMIRSLGKNLKALHIHDNNRRYDSHRLPYSYNIDFTAILTALKEVGYQGDITFESDRYFATLPKELVPAGARFMAEIGKYFVKELNK